MFEARKPTDLSIATWHLGHFPRGDGRRPDGGEEAGPEFGRAHCPAAREAGEDKARWRIRQEEDAGERAGGAPGLWNGSTRCCSSGRRGAGTAPRLEVAPPPPPPPPLCTLLPSADRRVAPRPSPPPCSAPPRPRAWAAAAGCWLCRAPSTCPAPLQASRRGSRARAAAACRRAAQHPSSTAATAGGSRAAAARHPAGMSRSLLATSSGGQGCGDALCAHLTCAACLSAFQAQAQVRCLPKAGTRASCPARLLLSIPALPYLSLSLLYRPLQRPAGGPLPH